MFLAITKACLSLSFIIWLWLAIISWNQFDPFKDVGMPHESWIMIMGLLYRIRRLSLCLLIITIEVVDRLKLLWLGLTWAMRGMLLQRRVQDVYVVTLLLCYSSPEIDVTHILLPYVWIPSKANWSPAYNHLAKRKNSS